jgi:hypothetical protein
VAAAGALLGCQDYRFNPVGRCTIQPGQVRVPLSAPTTADVLFVVDDSFSMVPAQSNLAAGFGSFITQLAATQAQRKAQGKDPLDFYIAVTTSSVLVNERQVNACGTPTPATCTIVAPEPKLLSPAPAPYSYACAPAASACGDVIERFYADPSPPASSACTRGASAGYGTPYFAGSFVGSGSNPKVLAFTKNLDWPNYATDPAIQGLIAQFAQNVVVGDCGANQEMHLEASRLAVQKALAGSQPPGWLHPGSKLVLVWVGNEDDCSTPRASAGGMVWDRSLPPGADSCVAESQKAPASQKLTPVADYASFFAGLGHPLGASFIRPGDAGCNTSGPGCVGCGPGLRFKAAAQALRDVGATVEEGSICDSSFSNTLIKIADLVKPPEGLRLPTTPAAGVVTQLRVTDSGGSTLHTCAGPDAAQEWWFVYCDPNPSATPPQVAGNPTWNSAAATADGTTPSACVAIKKAGACEPQPGQTLMAQYLGQVPAGGCPSGLGGPQFCADALGGAATDWSCDVAAGAARGTCLCKSSGS